MALYTNPRLENVKHAGNMMDNNPNNICRFSLSLYADGWL